jgi:hypothetical protein
MRLYASAYADLLGALRLDRMHLSALLLNSHYAPDMDNHSRYSDIRGFELVGGTYKPVPVTGVRVDVVPGGAAFFTDPILWREPSDLMPARYLALVTGVATALKADDPLFALLDLVPMGGAVEAQRGSLRVGADEGGWFALTTDSNPA